jgi:hypothetical protein
MAVRGTVRSGMWVAASSPIPTEKRKKDRQESEGALLVPVDASRSERQGPNQCRATAAAAPTYCMMIVLYLYLTSYMKFTLPIFNNRYKMNGLVAFWISHNQNKDINIVLEVRDNAHSIMCQIDRGNDPTVDNDETVASVDVLGTDGCVMGTDSCLSVERGCSAGPAVLSSSKSLRLLFILLAATAQSLQSTSKLLLRIQRRRTSTCMQIIKCQSL